MALPTYDAMFGLLDPVEALQRILTCRCGPRVRGALLFVIEGVGYRKAAQIVGLKDHADVYRQARRLGLRELHLRRKKERTLYVLSKRTKRSVDAVMEGQATVSQALRAWEWSADNLIAAAGLENSPR